MNIVFEHENKAILHSAKNLLELNGIECLIKNEHSATAGGNLGITNTAAELWILNAADAEMASSIIDKEILNAPSKPSWTCQQCNEENDGSFEVCWKCQSEAAGT
ncbi:MAG: DUF2007 domain-containing protein [Gammaproteobacteria bacterium]|jgi:hypothetical protein|nr:DUF2007 domain-containing protein [Gammaproteobacteria bacterium]|tara:strand:- start:2039 stop:2353 length:315 start_codon:yes stop_codon:yes gene_type:complete